MRSIIIALATLLMASPVVAEQPILNLQGPAKAREGVPIVISARKSTGIVSSEWTIKDHDEIVVMTLDDKGLLAYVSFDEPGTYTVVFSAKGSPPTFEGEQKKDGQWTDVYVDFLLSHFGVSLNIDAVAEKTIVVGNVPPPPPPPPPPLTVNPYPVPVDSLRSLLEPFEELQLSRADATALATLYARASELVGKSTADLREFCISEGLKLGLKGKYPTLAKKVDDYWTTTIGLKIEPMDDADRSALSGLAWRVWAQGR